MSLDTTSQTQPVQLPISQGSVESSAGAVGSGRGELIAKLGTVLSAILASSCCWLPLLLLAVGVSGAGIASTLAAYRPLFMVITFGFLGAAFYFTYRPKRGAGQTDCCAAGPQPEVDCCGRPIAKSADCCGTAPATAKPRISMMAINKVMLWGVTAMAIFFLFFPGVFAQWLGGGDVISADMQRSVVKIEGMTCEGCAPTAAAAIRKATGVKAVDVKYASGLATIGTQRGQPVAKQEILRSLKAIGFSGEFVEQ